MGKPTIPTDEQFQYATEWLRYNEGAQGEEQACLAVADWLEAFRFDAYLKVQANHAKIPVAALRRRLKAASAILVLLGVALSAHAAEDNFHRLPLATYVLMTPGATTIPTHLCVSGTVTYTRKERDGDIHVRLCDGGWCVVLEIIPAIPLERPRKGSRIEACGITRYDGWPGHGWHELHPLLRWEVVP